MYMGVSKIGGFHPKWMVKIMVPNPIKMDDLGVPLFLETPICIYTLPETNGSPLKIGRNPIGKACIPTIHFQGRAVSLREGIY